MKPGDVYLNEYGHSIVILFYSDHSWFHYDDRIKYNGLDKLPVFVFTIWINTMNYRKFV